MKIEYEFRLFCDEFEPYVDTFKHLKHKSSNNSVFVIKIPDDHKDFTKIFQLVKKKKNLFTSPFVAHLYNGRELSDAEILYMDYVTPVPGEMFGSDYGTKYDLLFKVEHLEVFKQVSPLRLNTSLLSDKSDIKETFSHEIIISKKLKDILEKNNVTGCKYEPVYRPKRIRENGEDVDYFSKDEIKSDKWYQLVVTESCGYSVPPTKYGIRLYDYDKKEQASVNDFKKYGDYKLVVGPGIGSAFYFNKSNWSNTDFAHTAELEFSGYLTHHIIISQRLHRILTDNKIKGIKVEPAYLV